MKRYTCNTSAYTYHDPFLDSFHQVMIESVNIESQMHRLYDNVYLHFYN